MAESWSIVNYAIWCFIWSSRSSQAMSELLSRRCMYAWDSASFRHRRAAQCTCIDIERLHLHGYSIMTEIPVGSPCCSGVPTSKLDSHDRVVGMGSTCSYCTRCSVSRLISRFISFSMNDQISHYGLRWCKRSQYIDKQAKVSLLTFRCFLHHFGSQFQ